MIPEPDPLPEIVFTLGDPNGIGPEVLLKALFARPGLVQPVIFGSRGYLRSLAHDLQLGELPSQWKIRGRQDAIYPPRWGKIEACAGEFALAWMESAVEYCRLNQSRHLVTGPIHKQAIQLAGFGYPGHTEFLQARFACERTVMAFFSSRLKVALVTVHIPLRQVPGKLSTRAVFETARLMREALIASGIAEPRLALCGLNPHASEGGLFGSEEEEILLPAADHFQRCFRQTLAGPFPSDTLFHRAVRGEFDAVIALYHDQGLIPIKLLAFDSSTNATLGLPLVRTSPDHGTAFDIAGKNLANPGSMKSAIEWALKLGGPFENPHLDGNQRPRPAGSG